MKKLCYICHGLGPNGIDTFIVNVLSAIDREKYDVSLIIAIDEGAEQFNEQRVRDMGIPIYRTNDLGGFRRVFRHYKKLKKLLKQIKPDIVHSNMDLLDGMNCFAAKLAGVSVRVSHAHGLHANSTGMTGIRSFFSRAYASTMKRMIRWNANQYCGCSNEAMEFVFGKKLFEAGRTVFIPNGIAVDRFRNVDRAKAIDKFGFDRSKRRVVAVGSLSKAKNPLFTVEIFSELCNIGGGYYELIWAGKGPMEMEIKEKAEALGVSDRIKLLGARNDVNEVMACGDAFIMPSIKEGLPLVIVEAQAAGLPCVASTAVPEQANCGKVIRLPLEDGAKAFAQTISDILDGKITMEIDEEKLSKFDIPYMIEQLEKVYES